MKILINFSALKVGGGKNVAMNFLHAFQGVRLDCDLFFFVAQDSEPHQFLSEIGYPHYHVVPNNPIRRILFELLQSSKLLKKQRIDIIYSYFGFGFYDKNIPQVSGSADSNLYFPEIDFWCDFKGLSRLNKKFIDWYRLWGVKRSTAVVFENAALESRGRELFGLKNTVVIKPSINFKLESQELTLPIKLDKGVTKGLFLCGWHPNKLIMKVPELAAEMKRRGMRFHFLLAAPLDGSSMHRELERIVVKLGVKNMVSVIGQVKKDKLKSLYEQVNYVFLLSKLESFSNNILEAWFFRRPLVVTDAPWSRSICADAALYVERDSVPTIAARLESLMLDPVARQGIVEAGTRKLSEYPIIENRIQQEIKYIENVYKNI